MAQRKNNLRSFSLFSLAIFSEKAWAPARWEQAKIALEQGDIEPALSLMHTYGCADANRSWAMKAQLAPSSLSSSKASHNITVSRENGVKLIYGRHASQSKFAFKSINTGTFLDFAIASDRPEWVQALLKLGARVLPLEKFSNFPIHRAIDFLAPKVAESLALAEPNILLLHSCEPDESIRLHRCLPLTEAVSRGQLSIATLLIPILAQFAVDHPEVISATRMELMQAQAIADDYIRATPKERTFYGDRMSTLAPSEDTIQAITRSFEAAFSLLDLQDDLTPLVEEHDHKEPPDAGLPTDPSTFTESSVIQADVSDTVILHNDHVSPHPAFSALAWSCIQQLNERVALLEAQIVEAGLSSSAHIIKKTLPRAPGLNTQRPSRAKPLG